MIDDDTDLPKTVMHMETIGKIFWLTSKNVWIKQKSLLV